MREGMRAAVDGWFTTGPEPVLLASRCATCAVVSFPPAPVGEEFFCGNPACQGEEHEITSLSRFGTIWSYTDAQYAPPPPYVVQTDPYVPFALAAVELPDGITVLGQVANGFDVTHLRVGAAVELVVEPLDDELLVWRWKPVPVSSVDGDQ